MNYYKLGDLCQIEKGKIGITKAVEGQYPLVTTAEARGSHNEYHFDKPAVIIPLVSSTGHGHASINRLHYQDGKFAVGSILAVLTPKDSEVLNAQYLYTYLSTNKDQLLVSLMRGAANVSLSISKVKDVVIPVPLIEKQLEIVKKFNNLQSDISDFHAQNKKRAALLKNLRQKILQDAVSGKLSEKWREENSNIESTQSSLEKITVEKNQLVNIGKLKRQKSQPSIKKEEIPFDLPEKWTWCRLGNITLQTGSGSTPRGGKEVYQDSGIPFIRSQNVYDEGLETKEVAYISEDTNSRMKYTQLYPKDILLNITGGSIGRSCIIPDNFFNGNINQHVSIIRLSQYTKVEFVHAVILSPYFQKMIFQNTTGAGRLGLQKNQMDAILVPLPPDYEQRYIVHKIEDLFIKLKRINSLESKSQENIRLLKQAALKEIF